MSPNGGVDNEALAVFASMVAGGFSAAGAYDQLCRVLRMPKDQALALWDEFERRAGLIRVSTDPAALVEPSSIGAAWYTGPEAQDRLWPALRARLAASMPEDALASVDKASTKVLSLLHSPGTDTFHTRGLVIGNVQSGKTTSFMSVIAKAADRGYRVFIVLSGITNNLRDQTQKRVDEMLVGDASSEWYRLTTEAQDFNADPVNASALLGKPAMRFIAVVKKNPGRLKALDEFIKAAGAAVLASAPILLIDDEADQASIDIGRNGRASKINGLLRSILANPRVGYLAYTATPFANLLIDPSTDGDLYPKDFVLALPQSREYFGAERIFGRSELAGHDEDTSDGIDIVRFIPDDEAASMRPPRGPEIDRWSPIAEPAMEDAIRWFLLSTAAKRVRDVPNPHGTMLIHTSMLAQAHEVVARAVGDFLSQVAARLLDADVGEVAALNDLYESETRRVRASEFGARLVPFEELLGELITTVESTKIIVDNYRSADRLTYSADAPTTAIVVGGNTLSRGLTLEGLSSSYFVRASTTYDTLLQMGRWFGYRVGYEDLCRVWMTTELAGWFRDLSLVEVEIRQEIKRFEYELVTPAQIGVRIRRHPSMSITSAVRMRNAVSAQTSYSTARPQTIHFRRKDETWLDDNLKAVRGLVRAVRSDGNPEVEFTSGRSGFRDVDATSILRFLDSYKFHEKSTVANGAHIRQYILKERSAGALQNWNIAVIAPKAREEGPGSSIDLGMQHSFRMLNRTRLGVEDDDSDIAYLKAIVTTRERVVDLHEPYGVIVSEIEGSDAQVTDASLLRYRESRPEGENGLLCIYPIDPLSKVATPLATDRNGLSRVDLDAAAPILGVAFFFPHAVGADSLVEYVVANIVEEIEESIDEEIAQIEAADALDEAAALVEGRERGGAGQ